LKFKITERFSFTTDTAHPPGAASLSPITWYKDYLAGEKYFDQRNELAYAKLNSIQLENR
jgi:hypothetical protein